jgi:ATP-dependent RNA helicase RhlE
VKTTDTTVRRTRSEARTSRPGTDAGAGKPGARSLQDQAPRRRIGDLLENTDVKAAVIHGRKSQSQRTRCLADFKAGRIRVLGPTDIAARGLDVAQLPLVVNYDLPLVAEDYVHRVGRTGRAAVPGHAVSLVTADEKPLPHEIQKLPPAPLEHAVIEGFEVSNGRARSMEPQRESRAEQAPRVHT